MSSGQGPDENTHSGLLLKLRCHAEARHAQLELVDRCCRYYAQQGVIVDDRSLPLHSDCPSCAECWAPFPHAQPPPDVAGISAPWIGPEYFDHRLCAIAINQNNYGGLGGLWWIARGAIGEFEQGRMGEYQVHLHAGYYMAAVLAALDLRPVPDEEELAPPVAASAWQRCAFLEAVKCAPVGNRSQPGEPMWSNCPARYLRAELEILAPRTLLVMGRKTWEAVKAAVGEITVTDYGEGACWRALAGTADRQMEIFFVNHPAFGHWRRSLPELLAALRKAQPHCSRRFGAE